MGGTKAVGSVGVAGPIGNSSWDYYPAARLYATAFHTPGGPMYLYSGLRTFPCSTNCEHTEDLWKLDPDLGFSLEWGNTYDTSSLQPVYGPFGEEGLDYRPGTRTSCASVLWGTDLYLFGGGGTAPGAEGKRLEKL